MNQVLIGLDWRKLLQHGARVERHALHPAQARERPQHISGLDRYFRLYGQCAPSPKTGCMAQIFASMQSLIPESELMDYACIF